MRTTSGELPLDAGAGASDAGRRRDHLRVVRPSTDVHDLKQAKAAAEESEGRFRAMADQTPIVLWVTNAERGIEFVNQAYCVLFGSRSASSITWWLGYRTGVDQTPGRNAWRHDCGGQPGAGPGRDVHRTLPMRVGLELDPAHVQSAAEKQHVLAASRRVLIVDDNIDAADTLAMLLDTLGCETRTAYDGEAALHEAATFHPELVLLDLGLPRLDGAAMCACLRQESWGAAMVIAAVTGWGQEEDRRRTKITGFDAHLVKPVDPEHLRTLVRELPSHHLM